MSAVETARSLPSDGEFRTVPSNAIVDEPPPSSAMPRTAAEADECLRELEVRHPDREARLATVGRDEQTMPPSARCPTAVRGPRGASCEIVNASFDR